MFINTAQQITGIPSSWPGSNLTQGSRGTKVTQLQEQLNAIAGDYPALPKVQVDGIYGPRTAEAVRDFQGVFGLPQTGAGALIPLSPSIVASTTFCLLFEPRDFVRMFFAAAS